MLIFLVHHALTVEIIAGKKNNARLMIFYFGRVVVSTGTSGKASIDFPRRTRTLACVNQSQ